MKIKCKGFKMREILVCLMNSKVVSMVGKEKVRRRVIGEELEK